MRVTMSLLPICLVVLVSCATPTAIIPQALRLQTQCVQSLQVGDYDGGKTRCELCLEYDENMAECINGLGLVAFAQGDLDKAIQKFSKAIRVNSDFGQARNNLGVVYFSQGNYGEALQFFKAALQIDPGYEDARYNAGLCYLRMGQKAATSKNYEHAKTYYGSAKEHYKKLIAVNPEHAYAYRNLALIAMYNAEIGEDNKSRLSCFDQADIYFKRCLKVDSSNESCLQNYSESLLTQKKYGDALKHFTMCLSINKNNVACIEGLEKAYQGIQVADKALSRFAKAIEKDPSDSLAHLAYCVALFDRSLNDMAIKECTAALQLDKNQCEAHFNLAMHYKKVLNSPLALQECNSYLICQPKTADDKRDKSCQRVVTALSGR